MNKFTIYFFIENEWSYNFFKMIFALSIVSIIIYISIKSCILVERSSKYCLWYIFIISILHIYNCYTYKK